MRGKIISDDEKSGIGSALLYYDNIFYLKVISLKDSELNIEEATGNMYSTGEHVSRCCYGTLEGLTRNSDCVCFH
jgi:hypothetical protein